MLSSPLYPRAQHSAQEEEIVSEPEFSEGAGLLAAARTIPTAHHALVKLLFGANDTVTASMDAAALDTD